jgi:hypothetical protein
VKAPKYRRYWRAPVEVKVVAGLLLGVAVLWIALVVLMVTAADASGRTFLVPSTSLVLGALVVGGLVLRMPSSRFAGLGVVLLSALLHAFLLLGAQLWWVKVFSAAAFAAYVYSGVLLNSMPLRRHLHGANA